MSVFVLDQRKRPVMPCGERRRLFLERDRAVVDHRYPFTIRSKDRVGGDGQLVRVKLDPGNGPAELPSRRFSACLSLLTRKFVAAAL